MSVNNDSLQPLKFTSSGYWQEVEEMMNEKKIPTELGMLLRGLINSQLNHTIPPPANNFEIKQVKEYLCNGIMISDSASDRTYDVMVYVPEPGFEETRRRFFKLILKYSGCVLKRVDEL